MSEKREYSVSIPGSVRSKKNSKTLKQFGRRRLLVPSDAYVVWERMVRYFMRDAIDSSVRIPMIPAGPCIVTRCHVYYKGPEPDVHGCQESIADALQGVLWADDGQIVGWDDVRKYHDKQNPRVELTVQW